jgi:hypothetical protein
LIQAASDIAFAAFNPSGALASLARRAEPRLEVTAPAPPDTPTVAEIAAVIVSLGLLPGAGPAPGGAVDTGSGNASGQFDALVAGPVQGSPAPTRRPARPDRMARFMKAWVDEDELGGDAGGA